MDNENNKEYDRLYSTILSLNVLSADELDDVLKQYDIDFLEEKMIIYQDFSVYEYANIEQLGKQLFDIYLDTKDVSPLFVEFFDFEAYGTHFIDTQTDLIELSDNKLIVFY